MDWAYWVAAIVGILVAAGVGLGGAMILPSAMDVSETVKVVTAGVSGVLIGAVVCLLLYWLLYPFTSGVAGQSS